MVHIYKKIMIFASLSSLWFTTTVAMDESKKTIDLSWLPGNLHNNAAATAASVPVIPFVMPTPQHDMSPEEKFNHAFLTIMTLAKRVDEQEKTAAEQSQQLQEWQQEVVELLKKFATLGARVLQGDNITAEQARTITEQSQQLQARQQEIDGINTTLLQKFAALEARIIQGDNITAEQAKTIAEQAQQLQARQQEIAGLKAQSTALQAQITGIKTILEQHITDKYTAHKPTQAEAMNRMCQQAAADPDCKHQ